MDHLKQQAEKKTSLKYIDLTHITSFSPHHLWPRSGCTSSKRVAASYRAKIITGSYILQSNRAKFNQNKVDPTCPLCLSAPEDLPHFLISCPLLDIPRQRLLPRIKHLSILLGYPFPSHDPMRLCKTLLNSAKPDACVACLGRSGGNKRVYFTKCKCTVLNELINKLCLDLHNCRSQVLSLKAGS